MPITCRAAPCRRRHSWRSPIRNGAVPTIGAVITRILPPVSRFTPAGDHSTKKQRVIAALLAFFDRFASLGS